MADAISSTGPFAVLAQAGALWAKQPKGRKTLAIAIVAIVAIGVGYATLFHHGDVWVALADGASPEDSSELYATLQAHDIAARLRDGKVEVTSDRATEARAIAASAGVLRGSGGFDLFNGGSLGDSSFAEQVKYRRALQGELGKSIASMAQVESARVLVAFGKTSPFKDQERAPTASVMLHLHAAQTLTAAQVMGIRQLVAKSLDGLNANDVVVIDQHGNLLVTGDTTDADRKAAIERSTMLNVRSILETAVGEGSVSVVTTADFDASKTNETEEVYDKDNPVIRSESRSLEGPNATAGIGGIAGTQGNLPGAAGAAPTNGSGAAGKLSETKNYEISRKVRQTEGQNGSLKKMHVAIVIDEPIVNGKPTPRSDAEIAKLTSIARTAAGFDEARGDTLELQSIAFAHPAEAAPPVVAADWTEMLPFPLPIMAAGAGGALLLIVLVVALLVRRSRRRARREAADAMPLALPAPLADIERVLEARPALGLAPPATIEPALPAGPPVQDRVLAAVRADVERAAAVLTSWLAEPPPKGAKP